MPSIRLVNLAIFLICAAMMLIAYFYMQRFLGLAPCALCMTQRIFVVATGVLAVAAWAINPVGWGRRAFAGGGALMALAGSYFAGRHVWLQSLPEDQAPACGPPLGYIIENFPLMEGLQVLLRGDGNCAEKVWSFLGLSIPAWTLVAFVGLIAINLWQLARSNPQPGGAK